MAPLAPYVSICIWGITPMQDHRDPLPTLVHACKGASISMNHLVGLAALASPPNPYLENLVHV